MMTLEQIAEAAHKDGIRVVILSDHDLQRWTYGIGPLKNFIKRTIDKKSVLKLGPQEYFDHIERINRQHPDVLLIGGVESAPFYYWTGNFFKGTLTLHNWHKHMLVSGLAKPSDYAHLPLVGNKSAFDQYHGDQGDAPYQAVIDYVNKTAPETGLVFWAHPESPNFAQSQHIGSVAIQTPPYPASLEKTFNYTGFAYFQEGDKTVGVPGGIWDKVLEEYCHGNRQKPVWAISELDYRAEGYLNTWFDSFTNILMMNEQDTLTKEQVIDHLRNGQFYCSAKAHDHAGLILDDYGLRNNMLFVRAHAQDNSAQPIKVTIISNGSIVGKFDSETPSDIRFRAPGQAGKKSYYRVEITSTLYGKIITNPVFCNR
jgi:hypothetical protein